MVEIILDRFTVNCLVFALCWYLVFSGINLAIKIRIFWLERKLIREQKRKGVL